MRQEKCSNLLKSNSLVLIGHALVEVMPMGKPLISLLIFLMHKEILTVMAAKAIVFYRHVVLLVSSVRGSGGSCAGLYYLAHTKQQLCAPAVH